MIWRDDDIGVGTNLEALEAVDDLFQRYDVRHTIAVMACGMESRPDLVEAILRRGMVPQLHCWKHDNLTGSERARDELARAVELMERLFGQRPTVLFPPWNKTSQEVEGVAASLGLLVSTKKVSLEQYIRCSGDCAEHVVNFHYWHPADVLKIEPALRIARERP